MPPLRKKRNLHRRKHKAKRVTVKLKTKKPKGISSLESKSILPNEEEIKQKTNQRLSILCKKDARGVVERLLCPYNTFRIKRPTYYPRKRRMSWGSSYDYGQGISPKERNYLVCSCQRKALRYSLLKAQAAHAVKHKKIFTVCGQCPLIRRALVSRGWIEKIPAARMDVTSIRSKQHYSDDQIDGQLERLMLSTLVEKAPPSFVWNARDEYDPSKDITQSTDVLYNKLRQESLWTTKQGLCTALQNYHWNHYEGVAEISCPRSYISVREEEKEDFLDDYKLTACTSLLKWLLSMIANKRTVSDFSGTIPFDVIVFALNRCKEYLLEKHNEDIDIKSTSNVTTSQWDAFLKKYYVLMTRKEIFEMDIENVLPGYAEYGKFLLKEIYTFRPQLSCEGCHNIWIIKPTHLSRGRGIRMASKLGVLTDLLQKGKYVFQKYIEEPLLIHETKFDIRQYFIISSTVPLEIWFYKDCYLKFSSQKYSLNNFHESIHLTNHAVQKKYSNCNDRHPELPQSNMWALATYKEYLRERNKEHVWEKVIYPGMRKAVLGTILCCQESIGYNKNRFELYGCDFILDKDHKPWLIEINACPDLNPTTDVTTNICSAVIEDLVKVMIDRQENPRACTGNFECIYRQINISSYVRNGLDFYVQGHAIKNSYFCKATTPPDACDMVYVPHDFKTLMKKLKKRSSDIMLSPKKSSLSSKCPSSPSVNEIPIPPSQGQSQSHHVSSSSDQYPNSSIDQKNSSLSFSSSNNFHLREIKNYIDELNSNWDYKHTEYSVGKRNEELKKPLENHLLAENVAKLEKCLRSKASALSSDKLKRNEELNKPLENHLLAENVAKLDKCLRSKTSVPRSDNLKRNEELNKHLEHSSDKGTRSSRSRSPRRKKWDKVTDLNFGDHSTKGQKRDRNHKITDKNHTNLDNNFSDVLAATNNLLLFFEQKEQEYNT